MSQKKLKGTFRKLLIMITYLTLHVILIWKYYGRTTTQEGLKQNIVRYKLKRLSCFSVYLTNRKSPN